MTNAVKSFHDLVAWQIAMERVTEIYKVSQKFLQEEMFGLTSQIRLAKAGVSCPPANSNNSYTMPGGPALKWKPNSS